VLVDWFTVGAQALNFLILVWLLKRLLYKPILAAIDARERRIAKELADADTKWSEAQKQHDEFQHKNDQLEQQRVALLSQATDAANLERQRLIVLAGHDADVVAAKRKEVLTSDVQCLTRTIRDRTQQQVFIIARKALQDMATSSLEERVVDVFTRRLRELDAPAKAGLAHALKTTSEPALVCSAFDLPAGQRAAIQNALNETFSAEIPVRFQTAPELIGGIELTSNGQRVSWSIGEYLASLERSVADLLNEKTQRAV
jgi:F-type H+-transporting ATPase subunit b